MNHHAAVEEHPVTDPGIEQHPPRQSDVDPAVADRAYRRIVGMLMAVPVLVVAFLVVYFAVPRDAELIVFGANLKMQTTLLGLSAGIAVLLVGMAAIVWARSLMTDEEIVDDRHELSSPPEVREQVLADIEQGIEETGIRRRKLIGSGMAGALGLLALPAVVSLADMGPWPTADLRAKTIEKTVWAEAMQLVNDVNHLPLKADEIQVGQLINAQPKALQDLHGTAYQQAKAKAAIIVVRMDPNTIRIPESRRDWQVDGILCYSKICTHVGCPISLWEQQTHHLLCPCHQSTFDLGNSGVVVFGPAARSLPQLPIMVDKDGYLVARSDFTVPVGPSYFERDSSKDFQDGDR
ncbi:MAG TPA: Rieske 2Fe-2S domain-containing protein [Propionicimonas sp.]|nr:Rieske 2Fe-2S domain-containing protein [Propionicimonas sp.]HQA77884.1 Rieske 2Fe-2S domain-containing protein [Propionicimonas sp.]HQD96225.1 Rieske 2Fe-2S domain-containing protein [Propionicimonas sp.]